MTVSDFQTDRSENLAVRKLIRQWGVASGWDIASELALEDTIRGMMSKHCDERSMADLVSSVGLPEACYEDMELCTELELVQKIRERDKRIAELEADRDSWRRVSTTLEGEKLELRAENEALRNRLLSVVFAGSRYIASHQGQRVVLQDAHAAGLYTEAADIFDALITKESLALNHDEAREGEE